MSTNENNNTNKQGYPRGGCRWGVAPEIEKTGPPKFFQNSKNCLLNPMSFNYPWFFRKFQN